MPWHTGAVDACSPLIRLRTHDVWIAQHADPLYALPITQVGEVETILLRDYITRPTVYLTGIPHNIQDIEAWHVPLYSLTTRPSRVWTMIVVSMRFRIKERRTDVEG